jgi:hypothetical protein
MFFFDSLPKSVALACQHWAEIALLVAAAIVVIGLIGELKSMVRWTTWVRWATPLVAIGVAGELLADGMLFGASERIQTIEDQNLLAVVQQAANRDITPDELNAVSSQLKNFFGQRAEIVEFPVSFEHDFIADSIRGVLFDAHWNAGPVSRLMSPPDGLLVQGVWIRATGDELSQAAAKALFEALKSTVASGGFDPSPLSNPRESGYSSATSQRLCVVGSSRKRV